MTIAHRDVTNDLMPVSRVSKQRHPHLGRRVATALLLGLCACAPATDSIDARSQAPSSSPPAAASPSHQHAKPMKGAQARQVRLLMEQLLGHHAVLMVRLMRGPVDGERPFVDAADDSLGRNTDELVAAVGSVYGKPAGSSFRELWTEHVDALKSYGEALATNNQAARTDATKALDDYAAKYGRAVNSLTGGRLPAGAVAAGVAEHIHHLIAAADAYAAEDYQEAFAMQRTAYSGMFSTGKALAGAIAEQPSGELPAAFDNPPAQLRSGLGLLLGEHSELAFDATRAVVAGYPSAEAAAGALNENTKDINTAMRSALGTETARVFSNIWGAHIDALVDFSVAVADGDVTAQSAARARLDRFPARLGKVLPALSGNTVTARTVMEAIHAHDQHLLQQVTSYAAKDYATSHEIAYAGYEHMHAIAATMADVLEGRVAGGAPRGGAATGDGGMAGP